jgi:hypothetical protein
VTIELRFPDDELDRLAERVADLIATRLQPPADEWLTTARQPATSACRSMRCTS